MSTRRFTRSRHIRRSVVGMREINHNGGAILRKVGQSLDEVEVTERGRVRWKIVSAEPRTPVSAAEAMSIFDVPTDSHWEAELSADREEVVARDPWGE